MRHGSPVAAEGAMAARCGGALTAAYHASRPSSEWPMSPTLPLAPGSFAAHSTASYPSRMSVS